MPDGGSTGEDHKPEVYECQDELQKNSPLIFGAWLTVREKIFAGHKLVRCYANAMCYGMDGTVHTDAHEPGNYTAVYYPHERWSPNWGGETMFYNQREDRVMGCFYPRPNSCVVFDGRIPHRANGVTRSYAGMRITLMFKTTRPETEKPDAERITISVTRLPTRSCSRRARVRLTMDWQGLGLPQPMFNGRATRHASAASRRRAGFWHCAGRLRQSCRSSRSEQA